MRSLGLGKVFLDVRLDALCFVLLLVLRFFAALRSQRFAPLRLLRTALLEELLAHARHGSFRRARSACAQIRRAAETHLSSRAQLSSAQLPETEL